MATVLNTKMTAWILYSLSVPMMLGKRERHNFIYI